MQDWIGDVVEFLEVPAKFAREWTLCQAYDNTNDNEIRGRLITALLDGCELTDVFGEVLA